MLSDGGGVENSEKIKSKFVTAFLGILKHSFKFFALTF